ncbi:MAG: hypothetical protein HQL31_05800 [Planctomycetes bacterium]|nr:hypothetical protein [Planctomycetota bacterium]
MDEVTTELFIDLPLAFLGGIAASADAALLSKGDLATGADLAGFAEGTGLDLAVFTEEAD